MLKIWLKIRLDTTPPFKITFKIHFKYLVLFCKYYFCISFAKVFRILDPNQISMTIYVFFVYLFNTRRIFVCVHFPYLRRHQRMILFAEGKLIRGDWQKIWNYIPTLVFRKVHWYSRNANISKIKFCNKNHVKQISKNYSRNNPYDYCFFFNLSHREAGRGWGHSHFKHFLKPSSRD